MRRMKRSQTKYRILGDVARSLEQVRAYCSRIRCTRIQDGEILKQFLSEPIRRLIEGSFWKGAKYQISNDNLLKLMLKKTQLQFHGLEQLQLEPSSRVYHMEERLQDQRNHLQQLKLRVRWMQET